MFPIAQGDASNIVDGAAVADHGCKTACGATLIAGQQLTLTEPSSGAGPDGASSSPQVREGFGGIGAGMAAAYHDEPVDERAARFKGRFQLVDLDTGEPIVGRAVRVRSTGGQYLTRATDAEGFTPWVNRDAAEALTFDLDESGA